ncbi:MULTISPECIES: hypothetical protein [Heyndrickxia]|jgi:hypothetical protein|uniref:YxiS n=2 Tax=Heyndrickxia coagulans TaxID=1398 RepID=A0AAW7CQH2_HEYCO|nr:hypothetical protein [Heyndrickxia coagulans]AEH53381.1 conserved hypothetical protein [Heyndrickxia coagulans 2-6]AJH77506.1 hypothetical protein BF29_346 [Heyndrickxia coagulans DSM 1 = ATCC 7050]MCR2845688.1 hypothetical protein [Heyndrickxia coagulans]MDL5040675.1 hypothetical protein [Heyndrickxia coagulans]MDR4223299.1 hypothetical protein [Heyndrickxia coagulans DSM 1 = ATCC 7050]
MDKKDMEEKIIQQYKMDEKMMALIFAQWCVNNGLDPEELYSRAYPQQAKNVLLEEALALTVPKEEAEEISSGTVLNVLSLFGNDDLAFVVSEEITKLKR